MIKRLSEKLTSEQLNDNYEVQDSPGSKKDMFDDIEQSFKYTTI